MTRSLALIAAATAGLAALPATATAKEARQARVCGQQGCTTQTGEIERQAVVAAIENGGPPSTPPNRHLPFYRVSVYMRGEAASEPPFRLLVVPGARRVRGPDGTWFAMSETAHDAWRRVLSGTRPFPAGRLPGVDADAAKPVVGGPLPPRSYAPALRPATSGDGTDWALIGASVGGSALIAGLSIMLHRRRRRRGGPQTAPVS